MNPSKKQSRRQDKITRKQDYLSSLHLQRQEESERKREWNAQLTLLREKEKLLAEEKKREDLKSQISSDVLFKWYFKNGQVCGHVWNKKKQVYEQVEAPPSAWDASTHQVTLTVNEKSRVLQLHCKEQDPFYKKRDFFPLIAQALEKGLEKNQKDIQGFN